VASPSQIHGVKKKLLLRFITIIYFLRLFRYVIMIVTFISIQLVIICVFFGAYMKHNRLYPLNLGMTKNFYNLGFSRFIKL
jgi:hypothetical protein